jgi:RNA polymerase-binding transcription factor DksA
MNKLRTHSSAAHAPRIVKKARTNQLRSVEFPSRVPRRWKWHYETLALMRDKLIEERNEALREAAEPIERHSMHQADSATNEFDRELAVSQLSAQQDALYEIEAAMRRILDGSYGACEQTGKRIPAERLKAVPWTRFREEVEAQLENTGELARPHLGAVRSVRDEPASALVESGPTLGKLKLSRQGNSRRRRKHGNMMHQPSESRLAVPEE